MIFPDFDLSTVRELAYSSVGRNKESKSEESYIIRTKSGPVVETAVVGNVLFQTCN
jgi:hypothetical protein